MYTRTLVVHVCTRVYMRTRVVHVYQYVLPRRDAQTNGAVQYLRHMSQLKHLKDSSVAHANCGERMAYGLTSTTKLRSFFFLGIGT
jgi:hypothetical protein